MQRIFAHGMSRELQTDQDTIEKMFPQIDELVDFTTVLVQQLNDRQHKSQVSLMLVYIHNSSIIYDMYNHQHCLQNDQLLGCKIDAIKCHACRIEFEHF